MRTTEASETVRRLATQGHLIGDTWRVSDLAGTYDHRYAATGEVQAPVGLAGSDDVDAAVNADGALPKWGAGLQVIHQHLRGRERCAAMLRGDGDEDNSFAGVNVAFAAPSLTICVDVAAT